MIPLCIYHANCADGLGAAWAVHKALGPEVEFVAAKYGEQVYQPAECSSNCDDPQCPYIHKAGWTIGEIAGRDILIVDFSYSLEVLKAMAQEARSILILDHHKTAQEDLKPISQIIMPSFASWLNDAVKIRESGGTPLMALFDMNRSGAGLTWDYLNNKNGAACGDKFAHLVEPLPPRPRIIDLIEDRDLWRFAHGDETRAFHAVLASFNWDYLPGMLDLLDRFNDRAEAINSEEWHSILRDGRAILRAQQQAVAAAVAASRRTIRIAGHLVPCANVPASMASDAGHLLGEEMLKECKEWDIPGVSFAVPTFSATYYDGPDRRHFSLRSPEGGADVGQVAKEVAAKLTGAAYLGSTDYRAKDSMTFSGGGHTHSAGFDAPLGWDGE